MMVYILCVDGSSGAEELHLVRERASAMRSERETPNVHRGNCGLILALIRILWRTGASWYISVIAETCRLISFVFNTYVFLWCFIATSTLASTIMHIVAASVCVCCGCGASGECISRVQTLPLAEGSSCAALLGNQAASSRAVELHFPATGHRLIFLSLLPSPLIPLH